MENEMMRKALRRRDWIFPPFDLLVYVRGKRRLRMASAQDDFCIFGNLLESIVSDSYYFMVFFPTV